MSQWRAVLLLDAGLQRQVSRLYEGRLPREIRHCLCALIESHDWDAAAVDANKARTCLHSLLVCLEEQWSRSVQENNVLMGPDLPGMKDYLLKHFHDEPVKLAAILSECLKEEKKIVASASEAQGRGRPTMEHKWNIMEDKVNELKRSTSEVKKEIKSLEFLNEKLDFIQETWQSQVEQHVGLVHSHALMEEECLKKASVITQTMQTVLQQIVNILKLAEQIVIELTGVELPEWMRRQQMACIGSPVDTSLDHLQKWFTAVAEVLLRVRELLQKLQVQNKKYNSTAAAELRVPMADIEKAAQSLFIKLLTNALLVEKQPLMTSLPQRPLVLKTRVRFTVTVRFLINLPEVQKCLLPVKPMFDKDVEEVQTVKGFRRFGFIKDDCKVLDVDSPGGGLVAEFCHMSLVESRGRTKGSYEPSRPGVTEELHIIKFVTGFHQAGLECNIEACSLPVVVISSTNQAPSAWASVMWCNVVSTSEPRNLSLFVDPPPITWEQMSQVLSWQFLTVGQRELDENQISMLRDKIVDDPDGLVHWSKFSRSESAWIWIDGILDLIKRYLADLWKDGSIMGFVSRERTRALLQEKPSGTFLLRFSESNKDGAITFSWVDHSSGESHVHAVEPYTKQELAAISLPYIIYHYSLRALSKTTRNPLLYLYPDIPKDTAFGRYYTTSEASESKKVDGYVNRRLIPVSVYPTPPPSPPREMDMMDTDSADMSQLFQELFSDLLGFPGPSDLSTSYEQMPSTPNSSVCPF